MLRQIITKQLQQTQIVITDKNKKLAGESFEAYITRMQKMRAAKAV